MKIRLMQCETSISRLFTLIFCCFVISPPEEKGPTDTTSIGSNVVAREVFSSQLLEGGTPLRINLSKIREFGHREDKPSELLYDPEMIRVDREGNIYVLDDNTVKKFSKEGKLLLSFGGKGRGPGETTRAISFFVDRDKNAYVLDHNASLVNKYSGDGRFNISFKVALFPSDIVVDSKGNMYVHSSTNRISDEMGNILKSHIYKYDRTGNLLCTFGEKKISDNLAHEVLINQGYLTVDESDRIFFLFKYFYEIREYDSAGELKKTFSRDLGYRAQGPKSVTSKQGSTLQVTHKIPWSNAGIGIGGRKGIFTLIPAIQGGPLDGGPMLLDMFNLDGVFLQTVSLPEGGKRFAVELDKNMLVVLNVDPVPRVSVYRITLLMSKLNKF